jgi:hypothetical protein
MTLSQNLNLREKLSMNMLKLLVSSALVSITFLLPVAIHSAEDEQKDPAGIQLRKQGMQGEALKIYQETADAQRAEEAEQQRIEEHEEADFRVFAIREAMIEECINTYRALTSPNLNYGQLYKTMSIAYDAYDGRRAQDKARNDAGKYDELYHEWSVCDAQRWRIASRRMVRTLANANGKLKKKHLQKCVKSARVIREDLVETMKIYERLYGRLHPRWEEVAKM